MTNHDVRANPPGAGEAFSIIATFPLMVIYAIGFMSATYMPLWVGAMATRYGVAVSRLGLAGSLELGAVALASILTAAFLDTRHLRWPIVLGLLISIAANLFAAVSPSVGLFTLARIAAGLANGFLFADVNRRAAENAMPSRVFAGQLFVMVAFAVVFFAIAPRLFASWGAGAAFFYSALAGVIALLSLPVLRTSRRTAAGQSTAAPIHIGLAAVLMLVALTLLFVTMNSIWAYLSPAAARAGVSLTVLSTLLGVGAVLNLAAPVASGWLSGGRVSPSLAITVGICTFGVCAFLIAGAGNALLFTAGTLFLPFCLMFSVPFYLSLLVEFDASGKCVATSAAFIMIGSAIGPSVGGIAMDHAGLTGLAVIGVATTLLAVLITWAGLARRTSPLSIAN